MKTYISGYYCRDDLHLQVMNKDSNRKILEALKEVYPEALSVEELARKTKLPLKTIYAQKAELYREYHINHLEEKDEESEQIKKRGRPPIHAPHGRTESLRKRVRLVIEEASGPYDVYGGKKPVPLPPGNVVYADGFTEVWHKLVAKEEEEELCSTLLQFVEKIFNRINNQYSDVSGNNNSSSSSSNGISNTKEQQTIKEKWAPERTIDFCCSQCGLNHEARDFVRAMLLHLIDQFDKDKEYMDFLKDNELLTQEAYELITSKAEKIDNNNY
jgi:hypothetical protein